MSRQEEVRALCLTIEGVEVYDDTKPRSQLAFGRLLGFTIGGVTQGARESATWASFRLFTASYSLPLFTSGVH